MRETVSEAIDRLAGERGDSRPEECLVTIQTLGGTTVLCNVDDLVDDGDHVCVTSSEYVVSDATVDLEEVR